MRKRTLFPIFLITIFLFSTLTTTAKTEVKKTTENQAKVGILFDEAHSGYSAEIFVPGQASLLGVFLEDHGFSVATNRHKTFVYKPSTLDTSTTVDLANYKVLVLSMLQVPLSEDEIQAVKSFVEDGGGLLMTGQKPTDKNWKINATALNPISREFGIEFNPDVPIADEYLTPANLPTHPIFTNINSIIYSGCTLNVTTSSQTDILVKNKYNNPVMANATYGSGKVLATGTTRQLAWPQDPFLGTNPLNFTEQQNWQFDLNLFNWLSDRPLETAHPEYPFYISILPGIKPSISEMKQYSLLKVGYHMHTTASDGTVEPADRVDQGEAQHYDVMIMTDHSYGPQFNNNLHGGREMVQRAQEQDYHVKVIVGTEVSTGSPANPQGGWGHFTVWPLLENDDVPRADFYEEFAEDVAALRQKHTLWVTYAHIDLLPDDYHLLSKMDEIGIDAVELQAARYYRSASGETAMDHPFLGACDAHSFSALNRTITYLFAKNSTAEGLIDALSNRRTVVWSPFYYEKPSLDIYNSTGVFFGDKAWLDEFSGLVDRAKDRITRTKAEITSRISQGEDLSQELQTAEKAETAFSYANPGMALELISPLFEKYYPTIPPNIELIAPVNGTTHKSGTAIQLNITENNGTLWYSWDGATNLTTSTSLVNLSLPVDDELHTLDVYAVNPEEDKWTHQYYEFTTKDKSSVPGFDIVVTTVTIFFIALVSFRYRKRQ